MKNEWQVESNGIKFFCWKDDLGLTTTTASDENQQKLEDAAKLLRADGYVVRVVDESSGMFSLVGKKTMKVTKRKRPKLTVITKKP